jgi:hypothetical protein
MDKKSLKIYVKKAVREAMEGILKENQPQRSPSPSPSSPDRETIERPPVKEPRKPLRRVGNPNVKPAPKNEINLKETEQDILDKIVQRFKNSKQ